MTITNHGSIKLIIGCMYSGKTSELIREYNKWKSINKTVLIINFAEDERYGKDNFLYSHDKIKAQCVKTLKLNNITKQILDEYEIILINEGQFFSDLKENVINWCDNYNKHIIVAGLDGDFERNKFGDILDLIPHADDVVKIKGLCSLCKDGTSAIFSLRITNDKEQKVIGSDNYIPVCRKHYKNYYNN